MKQRVPLAMRMQAEDGAHKPEALSKVHTLERRGKEEWPLRLHPSLLSVLV